MPQMNKGSVIPKLFSITFLSVVLLLLVSLRNFTGFASGAKASNAEDSLALARIEPKLTSISTSSVDSVLNTIQSSWKIEAARIDLEKQMRMPQVISQWPPEADFLEIPAKATVPKPEIFDALIPEGERSRRGEKMEPTYITVHSTQNYSSSADAAAHANLLKRGGLRGLAWHFSVDEGSIYQSLPVDEQGRHSDYAGKGDQMSIGIEMCENKGSSREDTLHRTTRLIAWLMHTYDIPLSNVVPHYHWRMIRPRDNRDIGHKNCPHFLMDDGKPGEKWQAFLDQINATYTGGDDTPDDTLNELPPLTVGIE